MLAPSDGCHRHPGERMLGGTRPHNERVWLPMPRRPHIATALVLVAAAGLASSALAGVPASAAVPEPAPVLAVSNLSPRVGEVVTISNAGTCPFGSCSDNLKWFPVPMAGPHLGTQIGTFRFPATSVAYSWSSAGDKNIVLTSTDGQSRLCCSASTSMVITVRPRVRPAISVSDVVVTEANSPSTAVFMVSLSVPARVPVSVHYATADSSAKAPGDYTARAGTVSFAVGEQTKKVPVTVVGDRVFELAETFLLNLTTPVGATIADGQGVAKIKNDDPAP